MASIKRRPDGKWRARYRDDTGREYARHFDRKVDAQGWLDAQTAALVTGTHVDPKSSTVTLEGYYAEWKARQIWAAGTVLAMDLAVSSCDFAGQQLGKIRRSHVEAWVKAQQTRGLAPSTIRTRLNNVRSVLRAAARDRLIPRDPSEGVSPPRQRRQEAAMRIPTPEEVGRIYDAAEPSFRAYVSLCAFAGLRLGEASAIQVGDIDFLRRQLSVTRQVQRGAGGTIAVTPPKYGSERTVILPDELLLELSAHISDIGVRGDEQWLFMGQHGDPPHQNTVGHWWRKTLAAAGLTGIRLHDLRHFYASGLIAAGCDVVTVQRALGHAKATTTLATYSHLWPDAADRTRAAASALYRSSRGLSADSADTGTAPSP